MPSCAGRAVIWLKSRARLRRVFSDPMPAGKAVLYE